jgi:hypothetical protein
MAVITVSRHPGSLGDALARAGPTAEHHLVERDELARLAERIGGPDADLARSPELRERSPSFWERLSDERRSDSSEHVSRQSVHESWKPDLSLRHRCPVVAVLLHSLPLGYYRSGRPAPSGVRQRRSLDPADVQDCYQVLGRGRLH